LIVLDASALIALIAAEPGADSVASRIEDEALLSTANLAEVLSKGAERGLAVDELHSTIKDLGVHVVRVTTEHAVTAGLLRPLTKAVGLGLGDRLCLALALDAGCPVLTTEKRWKNAPHGVQVDVIR
jgi:ribonuclease VapC